MTEQSPTVKAVRYLAAGSPFPPILENRDSNGRWIVSYCFVDGKDCDTVLLRNAGQAKNVKPFAPMQRAVALAAMSRIEASANVSLQPTGDPTKAHIRFIGADLKPSVLGQVEGGAGHYDCFVANNKHTEEETAIGKKWYGTLLHEIGHAVGLKHPLSGEGWEYTNGENGSIMSILGGHGPEDKKNRLGQADITALQHLYGEPRKPLTRGR